MSSTAAPAHGHPPSGTKPDERVKDTVVLEAVTKTWGVVRALHNVSLRLGVGEVVGLVGENGAGKSTLIGVVSGTVKPDSGSLSINGAEAPLGDSRHLAALGVSVVMQEQSLVENLRVYENLFLGVNELVSDRSTSRRRLLFSARRSMRRLASEFLSQIGLTNISAEARVSSLTFPQRQLVEIARAFVSAELRDQQAVILLDEPTSALSKRETEVLFELIERWRHRAAFVYVSHVLGDVRRMCTRIVVLKDGDVVSDLANVQLDDARLHELMVGRPRNADYYREALQVVVAPNATPVAVLENASSAGRFESVDLAIHPGEIVGVAGVVDSGASEIAAAVAGAEPIERGTLTVSGHRAERWTVRRAIRAGVLYVPPERSTDAIFASASSLHNVSIGVLDQLRAGPTGLLNFQRERRTVGRLVKRMRVKVGSLRTPAGELSGGNQQKLVFARWLDRRCSLLVLNDPTRGIDVGTREELYETIRALSANGVAILMRSESLEELIGLASRIVVMKRGRLVAEVDASPGHKPDEVDIVRDMI
jgi:ribose transport system ATP-binding protein